MAFSIFDDKSNPPDDKTLETTLGRSFNLWTRLLESLEEDFKPFKATWQFSGSKWGWNLKTQQKKRAIVYLTPLAKHFVAGFALGEKAVAAALEAGLSKETEKLLDEAPRYAEGRGVRMIVRNKQQLAAVMTIAQAKMST